MTERKIWCDLCKCSISNNPSTIKNHDLGPRHKDNLTKMSNIQEEKVAKDKEKKKSARVLTLTQIEENVSRGNQNKISTFPKAKDSKRNKASGDLSNATSLGVQSSETLGDLSTMFELSGDWEHDMSLGYYYNQSNGCYYDPNSGFYYTDALGKWVTLKEVLVATPKLSSIPIKKKLKSQTDSKTPSQKDNGTKKLSTKNEEKVAKDKEKKKKARVLTQVEEKESPSHQNDTSAVQKATDSNATSLDAQINSEGIDVSSTMFGDWEHDTSSGYYYNQTNGCFYDPNSGLFYTHDLGKWVTLKEALAATSGPVQKKHKKATSSLTSQSQPPTQSANKRKRPKVVTEEERALEVERKMVEEREKEGKLPIKFTYVRRKKE